MKYTLTDETKDIGSTVLHKIAYTDEFKEHILDKYGITLEGGWIESEMNLSQEGDCFVCDNAWVFGNASVYGDARVFGNACVYGNAEVYDDARVFGNACVYGDAEVYDDARVYGDAEVYDNAMVFGNARVFGNAWVFGDATVAQGVTCTCNISTTEQWYEYQHTISELNKKFAKEREREE